MVIINNYNENDFNGLLELMNQWEDDHIFSEEIMRNSIAEIFNNTDSKILIARKDGEISGYAQISKCFYLGFDPFIEIIQLLVSEKKRLFGIGSKLMEAVENEAENENIKIIRLNSQVHRSKSHVFYENNGYEYYKISKFYEKILK